MNYIIRSRKTKLFLFSPDLDTRAPALWASYISDARKYDDLVSANQIALMYTKEENSVILSIEGNAIVQMHEPFEKSN